MAKASRVDFLHSEGVWLRWLDFFMILGRKSAKIANSRTRPRSLRIRSALAPLARYRSLDDRVLISSVMGAFFLSWDNLS